jgi:hypothetical protein
MKQDGCDYNCNIVYVLVTVFYVVSHILVLNPERINEM